MKNLDPRTKIIMVICISTLSIVYQQPLYLFFLFLFTLGILILLKADLKNSFYQIKRMIPLFLMLLIVQSVFTSKGEALLSIGKWNILTIGGICMGISVLLRLLIIVTSAMILLTGSPRDFILALVQWKIPYEIAFMVMVGLHFIPIFKEEAQNVYNAVQMRGTELEKISLIQKVKVYPTIFIPIISSAVLRAQQMAVAMEGRAFRAYPQRTYMRQLILNKTDYILQTVFIFMTAGFIIFPLFI